MELYINTNNYISDLMKKVGKITSISIPHAFTYLSITSYCKRKDLSTNLIKLFN